MQSYLVVSQNSEFIRVQTQNISFKVSASSLNSHTIIGSPSISIASVRSIQTILSRKPIGGGNRLVTIEGINTATTEATNALLKILEEPPDNTYIILTSPNLNCLLDTLVSRCQIIYDKKNTTDITQINITQMNNLLKEILHSSPGERLLISQKVVKTKEEAIQILKWFIAALEHSLNESTPGIEKLSYKEIAIIITKVNAAIRYLEMNVNFKGTLDVLFLGFPYLRK